MFYSILNQLSAQDQADILRVARGLASHRPLWRWSAYTRLWAAGIMPLSDYLRITSALLGVW